MEHMAEDYANGISRLRILTQEEEKLKQKQKQDENEIYSSGNVSDRIFANVRKFQHEEYQYLNLIENIIENG